MQDLLALLKKKIVILRQNTNGEYDLNDDIIEHLYSVYPFNKFEYIPSLPSAILWRLEAAV